MVGRLFGKDARPPRTDTLTHTQAVRLIDAYDLLLSDLDGVVYAGADAIPHAVESLNQVSADGRKVGYLTNNASRTPEMVAKQLVSLGLLVTASDVVTSPQAAVPMLLQRVAPGSEVLVVGGDGLLSQVEAAGFAITRVSGADTRAVIQGFSPEVSWTDLAEASYAVGAGAVWIGTNSDWTIPKEKGVAPGNGTLLSAVHTATGVFPEIAGKPEKPIYEQAFARFQPQRALMVGDRLDTDILGANRVGIDSALVLTGIDRARQVLAAVPDQRPTYILPDLRDVHAHYEPAVVDGLTVTCGGSRVTLRENDVVVEQGDPSHVFTLRAAAALIWTSRRPILGLNIPESLY